ncbi:MAG: hypothetical protein LBM77_05310 [Spirochaetaceae bacterium]|jgi:hypothetical protein|nr:hypothetical protein [Spirochaetaceae bacterium]
MLAERQIVNADVLAQWFTLPPSFAHRPMEVFICPADTSERDIDEMTLNEETIAAFQETEDIIAGKIKVKSYKTVEEMNADLDAEYEAEYGEPCSH